MNSVIPINTNLQKILPPFHAKADQDLLIETIRNVWKWKPEIVIPSSQLRLQPGSLYTTKNDLKKEIR